MDDDMSLSYSQTKKFAKKCAEVSSGSFDPVFLLSSKYLKKVTPEFDKKGIRYDIEQGPFDYKLVFCERDNSRNPVVRNSEIHQQGSAVTYTIDTSGH